MSLFPYESQWGDIACNRPLIEHGTNPAKCFDWSTEGYPSEEEYLFWSRHICGLACLQMVLRAWSPKKARIAMFDLIRRAEHHNALIREPDTVRGLYYAPFVDWIREDFAIQGTVHPHVEAEALFEYVRAGDVALASVSSEILYPERPNVRQGGHLVLVHRFERNQIVLHNPSGVGSTAQDAKLDLQTFKRFFADRGITLRKPE